MKIEINGIQYTNPDFRVDKGIARIRLDSNKSFTELVTDFGLEAGDVITQYNDNDDIIGQYHIIGMGSILLPGEDGEDKVVIKYYVSQLGLDAQQVIETSVEDASDAALELAEMVAYMEETMTSMDENHQQALDNFDEAQKTALKKADDDITAVNERVTTLQTTLNQHTETIGTWESAYNRLADRVAVLENRLNGGN